MISSPRTHLLRLIVLLVVGIGGLLVVKGFFVPKSWDAEHWYRRDSLELLKQQPIVFGGNASCRTDCHGTTRKNHIAVVDQLAGGVHEHLACESCHGALHEKNGKVAPAQVPRDSAVCLRCHDHVAARPQKVGLFSETFLPHQSSGVKRNDDCMQCHDPHVPRKKVLIAFDGAAPVLSQELKALVSGCDGCHKAGTQMPLIAGQPEEYLRTVMTGFRDGTRTSPIMGELFGKYSNETIAVLARYYASADWRSAGEQVDQEMVKVGATIHQRRCAGCHGGDGRKSGGMVPRLAGQPASYVEAQLKNFLDPRAPLPNEIVRTIAKGLTEQDAAALAQFYASDSGSPRGWLAELPSVAAGCESCHRPGVPNIPVIAGQPEEYLRVVMTQHRDGTRSSQVMSDLLRGQTDAMITALAKRYSTMRWVSNRERADAALVKAGAAIHEARCAACHGADGRKAEGMTPRLAGQPVGFLEMQIRRFMDPKVKLPSPVMRTAVQNLAPQDIRALAHFYSADAVPSRPAPEAAASAAPMEDVSALVGTCDSCHAAGIPPTVPAIAGQPEDYLRTAMTQFRDGVRDGPAMGGLVKNYSNERIASLARHYARAKWMPSKSEAKADLAKRGKAIHDERCAGCHGDGGRNSNKETPRLAGQSTAFIEHELKRYQDPGVKLPHAFMRAVVKPLKPEDIQALANYYAGNTN